MATQVQIPPLSFACFMFLSKTGISVIPHSFHLEVENFILP